MTFREKLKMEHPEFLDEKYIGGCRGCPSHYGYEKEIVSNCNEKEILNSVGNVIDINTVYLCSDCWDREIPERMEE